MEMSLQVLNQSESPIQFLYESNGSWVTGYDYQCYNVRETVTKINLNNLFVSKVKYAWLMPNLIEFSAENDLYLTDVGGMPQSLISMSIINSKIDELAPFPKTLEYFKCNNNTFLNSIPALPETIIYMNIANCNISKFNIESILYQLIEAGLNNGYVNVIGNTNTYTAQTDTYISTLQGRGWTCIT